MARLNQAAVLRVAGTTDEPFDSWLIIYGGSITGLFPVFTTRKKKKTEMVGIIWANEGASLGLTFNPMGEFVALRDGDEEEYRSFILRFNSCV